MQWMTRTEWLPKVDGAVVGQSFWDLFVYNARASAGYAQLQPSTVNPLPVPAGSPVPMPHVWPPSKERR